MDNSINYRDFYCNCLGKLEAYQHIVADYQKEVNILKQGLIDYKNSPTLVREYRKNLKTIKRRLENYRHRMICLEDLFRHSAKEHA